MNNLINISQWNNIVNAVKQSAQETKQPNDVIYSGQNDLNSTIHKPNRKRYFCYDNYDRLDSPGLDLVINKDQEAGKLTVYNASEQAKAPITFEQGMQIAQNFFNSKGSNMAEEIVCDWVMDGNTRSF